MALWPGKGGNPPLDALALKRIFYNMMVDQWKISFLEQGLDLSDPNYTFNVMIWQFDLLEEASNLKKLTCNRGRQSQ